jgi:Uma2 family endonuclease
MTVMMERPQAISPPTDPPAFETLCGLLETMNVPEGYRAEIFGGNIVVSPWSRGSYRPVMRSIVRQLSGHEPEGHVVDVAPFLFAFPGQSRAYGPDIHVSDAQATNIDAIHLPGQALSLVAELTSESTAERDRSDKVMGYGKAGVPVYALVDMLAGAVVVHSLPSEDGYRAHIEIKFGETVRIPAPFDCELDTAGWES